MPTHIKEFLTELFPPDQLWKVTLLEQWQTIMGNLKAHVTLLKITEDTLTLGVFNSSWLQEMYLLSPIILETINKSIDQPRIKQLRFKQIAQKKKVNRKQPAQVNAHYKPVPLSSKQQSALSTVADEELRSVLYRFLQRCTRENV